MPIPKDYLGDAVYVRDDGLGGVILTTENGIESTNEIMLEPFVIDGLLRYLERMKAHYDNTRKGPKPQTIVAEVSKSWPNPSDIPISKLFEHTIEVNRTRGYKLRDWHFCQTSIIRGKSDLFETIIAVFDKV